MVERLVANEKVASSTLVTRSPLFPSVFPLYCRYVADYSFSKRDSDYVTIGYGFYARRVTPFIALLSQFKS